MVDWLQNWWLLDSYYLRIDLLEWGFYNRPKKRRRRRKWRVNFHRLKCHHYVSPSPLPTIPTSSRIFRFRCHHQPQSTYSRPPGSSCERQNVGLHSDILYHIGKIIEIGSELGDSHSNHAGGYNKNDIILCLAFRTIRQRVDGAAVCVCVCVCVLLCVCMCVYQRERTIQVTYYGR